MRRSSIIIGSDRYAFMSNLMISQYTCITAGHTPYISIAIHLYGSRGTDASNTDDDAYRSKSQRETAQLSQAHHARAFCPLLCSCMGGVRSCENPPRSEHAKGDLKHMGDETMLKA